MEKKPTPYEVKNGFSEHEKTVDPLLSVLSKIAYCLKTTEDAKSNSSSAEAESEEDPLAPLSNFEFFDKIMSENYCFNNYRSLRSLIHIFCKDDIKLSKKIIFTSLKNLTHYTDNVFSYLEALKELALLDDQFAVNRRDMIFGFPSIQDLKDFGKVYRFGFQVHRSLGMPSIRYRSPLNFTSSSTSLLKVLVELYEKYESNCFILLTYVLEMMVTCDEIFKLVIHLPSPFQVWANYHDWFFPFVKWYLHIKDSITYTHMNYDIMRIAIGYENAMEEFLVKLEAKYLDYLKTHHPDATEEHYTLISYPTELIFGQAHKNQPMDHSRQCLKPLYSLSKTLIVGCVKGEELPNEMMIYESESDYISIKVSQVSVLAVKSQPTGTTNLGLPTYFRTKKQILPKQIPNNTPLIKFLDCEEEKKEALTAWDSKKNDYNNIGVISLPKNIDLEYVSDYSHINEANARDEEEDAAHDPAISGKEEEKPNLEDYDMTYFKTNYLLKYASADQTLDHQLEQLDDCLCNPNRFERIRRLC